MEGGREVGSWGCWGTGWEKGRAGVGQPAGTPQFVLPCGLSLPVAAPEPPHLPAHPHPHPQVAVIAGNFELGELIRNHREQDVGERRELG